MDRRSLLRIIAALPSLLAEFDEPGRRGSFRACASWRSKLAVRGNLGGAWAPARRPARQGRLADVRLHGRVAVRGLRLSREGD